MILASASPRRRELLGLITESFSVIPASGEEIIPTGTPPRSAVLLLSQQKAREVCTRHKNEVVIAADTIVAVDNDILGEPADKRQAAEMLRRLSGRCHSVFTGVCVIYPNGTEDVFAEETEVEFYPLTDSEIAAYCDTGEPMDKAGAYGIQGAGALLVKRICGDYYNVMGLPVGRLNRLLRERLA